MLRTESLSPGARLRIWLRGEPGVRWSLLALRLDRAGRELGRVQAPIRQLPESYLPLELTPDTASVLVVLTALPEKFAIAHMKNQGHAFQLIFDKAP